MGSEMNGCPSALLTVILLSGLSMNIWPKKSANWCSFFLSVDTPALASSSLKRSRVA